MRKRGDPSKSQVKKDDKIGSFFSSLSSAIISQTKRKVKRCVYDDFCHIYMHIAFRF